MLYCQNITTYYNYPNNKLKFLFCFCFIQFGFGFFLNDLNIDNRSLKMGRDKRSCQTSELLNELTL